MADKLLSPFHIRNLGSPHTFSDNQDDLVRISAPSYEETISGNPAAVLKYKDEDRETITLGSSSELKDKLEEPVQQPLKNSSRKGKDRMSIAMLLSEAQQNPESLKHHVFDIEEREEIKKLWQEIQQRNKTPPPIPLKKKDPRFWTSAESALILRLRKEDVEWEDISKKMDRRTASDCKFYYEQILGDRLAVAYERRRKAFWVSVGAEIGITPEEAEILLWDIGQDNMEDKIRRLRPAPKDPPKDLMSVESANGDWYGVHPSTTEANVDASPVQKFEDYRTHHFNTTMPPQLHSYKSTGQGFKTSPVRLRSARASLRSLDVNPRANLTTEGKRQAQAAGDILRARTAPSRYRKAAVNANDRMTHQNRWADYKSSDTPFSTKPIQSPAQDFAKSSLTSEGKRQAQAAGDKLRCRTNPIRHSRPARSGSLEHGVHKNRWASYVAPRAGRSDDRDNADAKAGAKSLPESNKPDIAGNQPSLLEVFEAELAKDSSIVPSATENIEIPDPEISAIPESSKSTSLANESSGNVAPAKEAPPRQQANGILGGFRMIGDLLQGIADVDAPEDLSQMLEDGVRSAAGGLDDLLRGLTNGLQEVSDRTQQAADRTREVDTQGMDGTVKGLQDLVLGLTGGLGALGNDSKDAKKTPKMSDSRIPRSRASGDETHESSPTSSLARDCARQEQVNMAVKTSLEARGTTTGTRPESNSQGISRTPTYQGPQHKQNSSDEEILDDQQAEASVPRYHGPGPIHLPQDATMSRPEIPSLPRNTIPGYVDRLRRSQTTEETFAPTESRMTSPPAAATRFPTLAQFESAQNLVRVPSFPALPSMEPLVPQTATNESNGDSNTAKLQQGANFPVPSWYKPTQDQSDRLSMGNGAGPRIFYKSHPAAARKQHTVKSEDADDLTEHIQMNEHTASLPEPKTDRSQTWWTPSVQDSSKQPELLEQQNKQRMALDAKVLQQSAKTAPSQEQEESRGSLDGFQMQLELLEQQNKIRLCMARQEAGNSAEYPILPSTSPSKPARPTIPGTFPSDQVSYDQSSSSVTDGASDHSVWQGSRNSPRNAPPSSAARLVKPFDPLEAEPSAQQHFNEGIRRNATVAGTSSRHNATSRRPYSQAYEGNGRLSWDQFLNESSRDRDVPKRNKLARQSFDIFEDTVQQNKYVPPKRSEFQPKPPLPFVPYHRRTFDYAKADRVNKCIAQLEDLGYGHEDDDFGDRLKIYAEDADGDLQEAIEMIAEEQRAYDEGF